MRALNFKHNFCGLASTHLLLGFADELCLHHNAGGINSLNFWQHNIKQRLWLQHSERKKFILASKTAGTYLFYDSNIQHSNPVTFINIITVL
jgi:hypothetical protein